MLIGYKWKNENSHRIGTNVTAIPVFSKKKKAYLFTTKKLQKIACRLTFTNLQHFKKNIFSKKKTIVHKSHQYFIISISKFLPKNP